MSVGTIFWVLMVLWIILGFGFIWRPAADGSNYPLLGGNLLLFILLFLLGWAQFGFVVHR